MVGDFDEWQALYSSLMGFSPQPSKMHTRTGFFWGITEWGLRSIAA